MDKITQVIDMMAHPERYSEAQMEQLLQDEECRQTYLTMMEMRMAFDKESVQKATDVDQEWQKFTTKHHAGPRLAWRKIAAALAGVVMLSGLTYAAIHFSSHRQPVPVASADTTQVVVEKNDSISPAQQVEKPAVKKEIIHKTFDNVTMESMLGEIARYYGVKVVFHNEQAKQLRFYYEWNSENTLQQVVDELNQSQQMNISLEDDVLVIE